MLQGREEAFDAFFSRFFPPLYRFALARVDADANAAEEIVQATLSRAISRISTFRGEAALLTWLCTFCRHEISAHYRGKRGHRLEQLIEDAPEIRAALESLAAAEESPEGAARRKQLARMVQATLDQLPGHYGDALEWKYVVLGPLRCRTLPDPGARAPLGPPDLSGRRQLESPGECRTAAGPGPGTRSAPRGAGSFSRSASTSCRSRMEKRGSGNRSAPNIGCSGSSRPSPAAGASASRGIRNGWIASGRFTRPCSQGSTCFPS